MTVDQMGRLSAGPSPRLQRFSWALFDWAQQPYFTLAGAFLFKPYFSSDFVGDPIRGQALIGLAGGIGAAGVALVSPLVGASLDGGARPKRWIMTTSVIFVLCCAGLWFAQPGRLDLLPLIMAFLVIAAVSGEVLITANNAMLPHLTTPRALGRLSGSAVALGFLGGLAALILYMLAFNLPDRPLFGLDKAAFEPQRFVGPYVAIWYAVFILPMLLWTPDRPTAPGKAKESLRSLLPLLRRRPAMTRFLIGRMLIGDGLSAASVFAGILAAGLFDWETAELATFALLIMTLSGVGAWITGVADDRFGPKTAVMVSVALLCVGVAGAGCVTADRLFFVIPITPPTVGDGFLATTGERLFMGLGVLIGLSAGPLQASLRSWLAKLAPQDEIGRWFGLFAFSNKATAFAAPLLIAGLTLIVKDQRVTIPVVLVFLVAGLICLRKVPEGRVEP